MNSTDPFTSVVAAANQLLAQRTGRSVQLADVTCISEEGRRNRLLRVRVEEPSTDLPASLMIKQVVAEEYNPDRLESWDTQRFFRDWAGAEFLTSLFVDKPLGPVFYGGDRQLGFIILEDLGDGHPSLVQPLLEGNATSAEAALTQYARCLGQIHAVGMGKAAEYQAMLQAANPAWVGDPIVEDNRTSGIEQFGAILSHFDLPVDDALRVELSGVYKRLESPGPFFTFLHADLCPDNLFFIGNEIRLFDFETARFGNALIDGCYPRLPFPSCWCCNRIPKTVVQKLEKVYRAELVRGCPAAADDQLFAQALGDACVYWTLEFLRWWEPASIPQEDRQWGLATVRSRVLSRLETCTDTATEFDILPNLNSAAGQLLTALLKEWPESQPLPLYPAFR